MGESEPVSYRDRTTEDEKTLHAQLITSSWCGLLAALTPLIDAATDESATENVLKAMQNYASICGTLGEISHIKIMLKTKFLSFITVFRLTNTPRCIYNCNLQVIATAALCFICS